MRFKSKHTFLLICLFTLASQLGFGSNYALKSELFVKQNNASNFIVTNTQQKISKAPAQHTRIVAEILEEVPEEEVEANTAAASYKQKQNVTFALFNFARIRQSSFTTTHLFFWVPLYLQYKVLRI